MQRAPDISTKCIDLLHLRHELASRAISNSISGNFSKLRFEKKGETVLNFSNEKNIEKFKRETLRYSLIECRNAKFRSVRFKNFKEEKKKGKIDSKFEFFFISIAFSMLLFVEMYERSEVAESVKIKGEINGGNDQTGIIVHHKSSAPRRPMGNDHAIAGGDRSACASRIESEVVEVSIKTDTKLAQREPF